MTSDKILLPKVTGGIGAMARAAMCLALLLAGAACVALSMQPERRIGRDRETGREVE